MELQQTLKGKLFWWPVDGRERRFWWRRTERTEVIWLEGGGEEGLWDWCCFIWILTFLLSLEGALDEESWGLEMDLGADFGRLGTELRRREHWIKLDEGESDWLLEIGVRFWIEETSEFEGNFDGFLELIWWILEVSNCFISLYLLSSLENFVFSFYIYNLIVNRLYIW